MSTHRETAYEDTEVRQEVEIYDPECSSENFKYTIYPKTDLKFASHRRLDIERLRKHNPRIQELHMESLDTIIYRLKECVRTGSTTLDLSNLGLTQLPPYNKIPPTVKHMFLANNEFNEVSVADLRYYNSMIVLDIDHNKFTSLPKLPLNLIELSCADNMLTNIDSLTGHRNLKRIEISHNRLTNIPDLPNVSILRCTNNSITHIGQTNQLQKLWIDYNKISHIRPIQSLTELHANNNLLTKIDNYPNLKELCINNNKLTEISNLGSIQSIQLNKNYITKFPYFATLQELTCNSDELQELSKRYKIQDAVSYKDKTTLIIFTKAKK